MLNCVPLGGTQRWPGQSGDNVIRRGYVDTSAGQIHFRTAGTRGPWVALLHETPASSVQLEPAVLAFSRWSRVIAWDTPGYGSSDEGPPGFTIESCARVIGEAMSALTHGEPFVICGTHTGACIAIAMALYQQGVEAIVLVGIPVYTESELTHKRTQWAPQRAPDAQGTHLEWAWKRVQKGWPGASVLQTHAAAMSLLTVLGRYERAYEAVFDFDTRRELSAVKVPVLALAASGDRLAPVTASIAREYGIEHLEFAGVDGPLLQVSAARTSSIVRDFLARKTQLTGSTPDENS